MQPVGETGDDALQIRELLVEIAAQAIEFVPSQHTRKNTLIRAVRTDGLDVDAAWRAYESLRTTTGGVAITLEQRLRELRCVAAY